MNRFSSIAFDVTPELFFNKDKKVIDEQTNKSIDAIWEGEKKKKGDFLFNGPIVSLESVESSSLYCSIIDYKRFVAQNVNPDLAQKLQIMPLGVSAITFLGDICIIGKRSSKVMSHPCCFEFAPSGSVDGKFVDGNKIDLENQILSELVEELGFSSNHVLKMTSFMLFKDHKSHYAELCFKIYIDPHFKSILKVAEDEYDEVLLLSKKEMIHHLHANEANYVPLTKHIIETYFI